MDLTFELDLWGRLRRGTEAARAELGSPQGLPLAEPPSLRMPRSAYDAYRASVHREVGEFLTSCQSHPSVVVVCGGSGEPALGLGHIAVDSQP